jgi:gamma-glutamyltranspeptidase
MPEGVLEMLLSKIAALRRSNIDQGARRPSMRQGPCQAVTARVDYGGRDRGDTIYLTAADQHGNVVSLIQSLFNSFGAGFVAGETGITLQNRASGFHSSPAIPIKSGRTSGLCIRSCPR